MRPLLPQHTANIIDVRTLPHKGSSNEINVLGHAEVSQVRYVLLGEGGEVDNGSRKVHVLALADGGGVLHLGGEGGGEGGRRDEMKRQILCRRGVEEMHAHPFLPPSLPPSFFSLLLPGP